MAKIGLKNIYVAKITKDDSTGVTYEAPKKLSPAMTVNMTPNFEIAELYGDDQLQEVDEALASIDIEFGINELSLADYAFIMGKTVDANGGVVDSANDVAPYFAFGYELPFSGGKGSLFTWLYKGKFTVPSEEAETKQGSITYQTPTVTGKFMPRTKDGLWRYRVETNASNEAVTKAWFTAVQETKAATTTPTTTGQDGDEAEAAGA